MVCLVVIIVLLCAVLDFQAKLNCFMQRKTIDFSRLPIVLKGILVKLNGVLHEKKVAEITGVRDISLQERFA